MKDDKKNEKPEDNSIFEEARKQALKEQILASNFPEKTKEEKIAVIKEKLENGETQWDLLQKMINGSFTERFINVMNNMSDRDFSRNYLKLLEYFKPKITRMDGEAVEDKDVTVNVQMVIINEEGEKEVIEIDHTEEQ